MGVVIVTHVCLCLRDHLEVSEVRWETVVIITRGSPPLLEDGCNDLAASVQRLVGKYYDRGDQDVDSTNLAPTDRIGSYAATTRTERTQHTHSHQHLEVYDFVVGASVSL